MHLSAREDRGDSSLDLLRVGLWRSGIGLAMYTSPSGAPTASTSGVAFLGNRIAARLYGGSTSCPASDGPLLELDSDFSDTWLNYVVGNGEGFVMSGSSRLEIDHTALSGNVRHSYGNQHDSVFDLNDATSVSGRNLLLTDNDTRANPGDPALYPRTPGHVTPPADLYTHDSFEIDPLTPPAGLFPVGSWGVDQSPDSGDLDVGFHVPL